MAVLSHGAKMHLEFVSYSVTFHDSLQRRVGFTRARFFSFPAKTRRREGALCDGGVGRIPIDAAVGKSICKEGAGKSEDLYGAAEGVSLGAQ